LQGAVTSGALICEIDEFLSSPSSHKKVLKEFDLIHKMLRKGASDKAAHAIASLIAKA
jgi:lipid A disaccharide synthetase